MSFTLRHISVLRAPVRFELIAVFLPRGNLATMASAAVMKVHEPKPASPDNLHESWAKVSSRFVPPSPTYGSGLLECYRRVTGGHDTQRAFDMAV